ncbi:MAG: PAS domain-containing protein [Deltaproteobacteria bacterium]|jgi:PAS domain-containing protein|nr:PAS domain-containing protein [Deltaproteobacteria bacterium]MBP6833185.1 PAS domain-containing protein [Deltaproteobacteria bacterium]
MQRELEIILTRQLASYLATPAFIVDPEGNLLFYNDPAEALLGHRFDETGEMLAREWSTLFSPTDAHGASLPPDELPLLIALRTRHPSHREFWITGLDGARRHLVVTALPLVGQAGRVLGAMALFWEGEEAQ